MEDIIREDQKRREKISKHNDKVVKTCIKITYAVNITYNYKSVVEQQAP